MLFIPTAGLLAQGQYDLDPLPPFPDHVQYTHYSDQIGRGLAYPQVSPSLATSSSPDPPARDRVGWGDQNLGREVGPWLSCDLLCPWGWQLA